MKQIFNVFLTAIAVCFAVNLTSCSSDDDDSKSTVEKIKVYTACVSESVLDLYNVKLVLHSGDNVKEVNLSKSNGVTKDLDGHTLYSYQYDTVDGNHGIDSVAVTITNFDKVEGLISAIAPDKELVFVVGRDLTEQTYSPTGHYDTFMHIERSLSASTIKAGNLLKTSSSNNITKVYELEGWNIINNLKAQ